MNIDGQMMELNIDSYEEMIRRFKILEDNKVDFFVLNYVNYLIRNVSIGIFGRDIDRAINLIKDRKLEGYCWETTSILIPFFEDNDYVSRGNLYLSSDGEQYHHSWINFSIKGNDYVFDPSLSFLCLKKLYDEMFEVETECSVSSLDVKDKLFSYLNHSYDDFVEILGTNDINDHFYRVNAKVRGKVKKNNITSLYVKY